MVKSDDIYPQSGAHDSETEADVFGTWFARLGAIALLIGAAFGFKYAVDEGFIGPEIRVLLGVAAGLGMIVWGEWCQRKDWARLAQSVSGGGVALLYLSTWSAFQLYGLISGTEAFVALTLAAITGGYLALRYDSMALAVLATIGGFTNAILIGEGFERPTALFGYIVILDCMVLGLAYFKRWRALDHLALVATWVMFTIEAVNIVVLKTLFSSEIPETGLALTFATVYFVLFMSLSIARRISGATQAQSVSDLFLMVGNSIVYFTATMALLSIEGSVGWATHDQIRGPAILVAAGVHLVAGAILRTRKANDPGAAVALGSAVLLAAVWVPVELLPYAVPAAWAVQGAFLVQFARKSDLAVARVPGYILAAMSLVYLGGLASDPLFYDPERLLLSGQSAAFVLHIAALYTIAAPMIGASEDTERALGYVIAVIACVLTVTWMSLEAMAYFRPYTETSAFQSLHFTLTGIWGLYSTALLAVGILVRNVGARFLGLALFGVTLLKLTLHDVWMLDTLYRTIVFMGLGVVCLGCSVMYHRFKDLILRDRTESLAV